MDEHEISCLQVLINAKKWGYSWLTDSQVDCTKTLQEINTALVLAASFTDIRTGQPVIAHIETVLCATKRPFAVGCWCDDQGSKIIA